MLVRQLLNKDVDSYKEDITEYIYESIKMSNYESSYQYGDAEKKTEELYEYIEKDKAIVLGAFDENKLIGFLWSYQYPFRDDKDRLYISILHVNKNYRGMNIGSELMKKIEYLAKERGYDKLFLHAEATNNGACNFYKKHRFNKERIQFVRRL